MSKAKQIQFSIVSKWWTFSAICFLRIDAGGQGAPFHTYDPKTSEINVHKMCVKKVCVLVLGIFAWPSLHTLKYVDT